MGNGESQQQGGVATRKRRRVIEPPLYKVLLHNDDYTTMDFVISVLETVFGKTAAEATRIMLAVHHEGVGVAGIYTREVAETKTAVVNELARQQGHPLKCSMEKA